MAHEVVAVAEDISIHALHEESDESARHVEPQRHISIHALHEESDSDATTANSKADSFQSTLSMRRATSICAPLRDVLLFQSTLSMRRATKIVILTRLSKRFQSTLSMRRATKIITTKTQIWNISIHALHEESDANIARRNASHWYFNPRSP